MKRLATYAAILWFSLGLATFPPISGQRVDRTLPANEIRTAPEAEVIKYYFGSIKYASPDGSPRGESISLVKRLVSPLKSKIIETVLQPAREKGKPAVEFVTTLTRAGEANVFSVSDSSGSLSGSLTYSGESWNWNAWTYDLRIGKDDQVSGEGTLSNAGLVTRKLISRNNKPYLSITEDLKAIDEIAYQRKRKEMTESH